MWKKVRQKERDQIVNDNILQIERDQPVAANAPASLASVVVGRELYMLDWQQTEIALGKGRKLTLRRPTQAEILERDAELQTEIPIGKDGGYQLPDPTLNEAIDAKYFDLVKVGEEGYAGTIPEQHKAAAFNGLYKREIYVDADFDFDTDKVLVLEEIGGGAEPDYTIAHVMRPPTEAELKLYRRKSSGGEIKPGKRGRQIFKTASNLKTAMSFYAQWLTRLEGAMVGGEDTQSLPLPVLTAHVDPLIQRQVVNAVVEAYTAQLSD